MMSPPPRRRRALATLLLAAVLVVSSPHAAAGQQCIGQNCRPERPEPGHLDPAPGDAWQDHATVLGVNAVLGGVTAGVRSRVRGGSFWRGFAAGAAGGGLVYAGKWMSAEHYWGAGLAGRQVAAVGASVIRNASEDRALLDRLMLPVGPVRVYVDRAHAWQPRVKLDLASAGVLAYWALARDTRLDARASASSGAPVFLTEAVRYPGWRGTNGAGVILLRDDGPMDGVGRLTRDLVFAHERIHLLQYDHLLHTWSAPAEAWLLDRVPGGAWLGRHVDLGLIVVPVVLLNRMIPYEDRPWEREADIFSGSK